MINNTPFQGEFHIDNEGNVIMELTMPLVGPNGMKVNLKLDPNLIQEVRIDPTTYSYESTAGFVPATLDDAEKLSAILD